MWHGSLSRHAGFVLVLYTLLASIAVIAVDLRLLLIPAACIALGLVTAGLVVFRPLSVHVRIPWPAQTDLEGEAGVIVVNGNSCPILGYEQELLVEVGVRRLTELLSCSLLAVAALYVMLSGRSLGSSGSRIGAFDTEFICIAGCMVLLTCLRWFTERQFLRSARITFGSILCVDPGFFQSGVTYQFFDQNQERRGGKGPLPRHSNDNVVLVFYRPDDPDTNTIHGAFAFHQFGVELLPGRRKAAAEAGVQG